MRIFQKKLPINITHLGMILLAILLALLVGISPLLTGGPFTPLYLLVMILGLFLLVLLFLRPILALYVAIFASFLPDPIIQLIPFSFLANYFISLAITLAFASWLISVIINKKRIIWNSTTILLTCFTLWCIFSLIWSPDITMGRESIITIIIGMMLFMTIQNQSGSVSEYGGALRALSIVGWGLELAGIGTILLSGYSPGDRLSVLGINENTYGLWLIIALAGVIWQGTRQNNSHRHIRRLSAAIYLIVAMGLIVLSGSRGSVISLVIILIMFLFWKSVRFWGILGLLIIVIGLVITPYYFSIIIDRFNIRPGDTLLGGREAIWEATWNMIMDYPILGVGIGNARTALIPYIILLRNVGRNVQAASHNPILQVWAETGLPGIILYMSALVSTLWMFFRKLLHLNKNNTDQDKSLHPILAAVALGYFASWIKAGGIEYSLGYFLLIALLQI